MPYVFKYGLTERENMYGDPNKLQNQLDKVTESRNGNRFNFTSPVPGLHIYDNVWPDSMDFINEIRTDEYWENNEHRGSKPWIREDYYNELNGKKAETCWVWNHPKFAEHFQEIVDSYLWQWDLNPLSREAMRISRYEPGEFFSLHADDSYGTPRTVSLVYYPNDDYEGGELEFIHFGVKIKPKAGQLFLFPSAYSYMHKIHGITSGVRYTLVSFFAEISEKERQTRMSSIEFPYTTDLQYQFE